MIERIFNSSVEKLTIFLIVTISSKFASTGYMVSRLTDRDTETYGCFMTAIIS